MNKAKTIGGILAVFVTAPIWYYLLYKLIENANGSDLMWFLYWAYVPVGILVNILANVAGKDGV